jgi:hypothetical protein
VGCVMYVPGSSSGLYERTRGGEDEMMGSSRYIVWSRYIERMGVEARAGRGTVGATACVAAVKKTTRASVWQTKAGWCGQSLGHWRGFYGFWSRDRCERREAPGRGAGITKSALTRFRVALGPPLRYCFWIRVNLSHVNPHPPTSTYPHTMTTRRIVGEEPVFIENDPRGPPGPSDVSPAVPSYVLCHTACQYTHAIRSVIFKLMSFTFAMITLPIGSYFFTVNFVFNG